MSNKQKNQSFTHPIKITHKNKKYHIYSIDELKYTKLIPTSSMNPTYAEILKANSMRGNEIKKIARWIVEKY